MRYYDITITDPVNPKFKQVYTSWVNGQNDPGALNISFDFLAAALDEPQGNFMLEISGIPLQSISQAANLNRKNVLVSAGFQKGLPLANPAQAGPIAQGFIVQAFGNWIGTDMTLDLVISPGSSPDTPAPAAATAAQAKAPAPAPTTPTGTAAYPLNGAFSLPAGIPLSVALGNFLAQAMPGYTSTIAIQPHIVVPVAVHHVARTLPEFAQWVRQFSRARIGGSYPGVQMRIDPGNRVVVWDGSAATATTPATSSAASASVPPAIRTVPIAFQDIIGQPTWIDPATVQFKTALRADIAVGYIIKPPAGFYGIVPAGNIATQWNYRNQSVQQGTFTVTRVRQLGNFRAPDAGAWVTVIDAAFVPAAPVATR